LKGSFPNVNKTIDRETVYNMLDDMRKLRNDIMHHVAIFDRKPRYKMENIINILELVSTDTRIYVDSLDKLSFVINQRPRC
jgi:hypothetical protein